MTPAEYLEYFYSKPENKSDWIIPSEDVLKIMKEYAKFMCDKQKEICYVSSMYDDAEFILNASYPEELQKELL